MVMGLMLGLGLVLGLRSGVGLGLGLSSVACSSVSRRDESCRCLSMARRMNAMPKTPFVGSTGSYERIARFVCPHAAW